MKGCEELVAHLDKDNFTRGQLLLEHLIEVSKISKKGGNPIGLGNLCELQGLLHDFGKSSEMFQLYIRGEYKGRVNHSSAGAKALDYIEERVEAEYEINKLLESKDIKPRVWRLYKEIMQYPILAHHGLYDIIDNNFDYRTSIRLDYDKDREYDFLGAGLSFLEDLNKEYNRLTGLSVYELYYEGFIEFIKIYIKLKKMASELRKKEYKCKALNFYYGAFVRLILSILKEADIYDSSNYYRKNKDKIYDNKELSEIWREMEILIEQLYDEFDKKINKSDLDITRTKLANEICDFSKKESKGAYKLSMPVGSGKTYAALRFALGHSVKFNKSRIFYSTAFLSVLEQNANSIREVIGDGYVLEHHSNIVENFEKNGDDQDQKEYLSHEYLKESWESPVTLTTIVQISNSMFKGRASNIRRFSKFINSVIIIDEIQSLPSKAIYNFNLMTNFLTQVMNCTILHCTATQPNFDNNDSLRYPCLYGNETKKTSSRDAIQNPDVFDRVDYHNLLGKNFDIQLNTEEVIEHIKNQFNSENSALIVLNTKKAVANLYEGLLQDSEIESLDCEIIYLTTNQCPKHRLEIITRMKKTLKNMRDNKDTRKLICVSTKLVEAGVDIDFDLVYRSIAGVDSIIQCGGRCNREGKKNENGKLFIFEYGNEDLRYLPDLKKQRIAAISALRNLGVESTNDSKIDIEKASDYYFYKLFSNEEVDGKNLEYPIEGNDTILNLLTTNPIQRDNFKIMNNKKPDFQLRQSFRTAATKFNLINENTVNVIVQYKNDELINELYEAIDRNHYGSIKKILKKLQPYTISIRRIDEYERYVSKELEGEILILNNEAYDDKIGIVKTELQLLIC